MITISFDQLLKEYQVQREARCISGEDDIVTILSGGEGSGKSMMGLALSKCDPGFVGSQVYYFWKDYRQANLQAAKSFLAEYKLKELKEWNDYGLTEEDLKVEGEITIHPGSSLLYDESATQLFNRSAGSSENIEQVKLFISNRFNRLVHFLCVPKVKSMDKYIREERLRFFIFIFKKTFNNFRDVERTAYVWSAESYQNMMLRRNWERCFRNEKNIAKVGMPDFKVKVPDLIEGGYIPKGLLREYKGRKVLFNIAQIKRMEEDGAVKAQVDYEALMVQPGESKADWVARTKRSPASYNNYK